MTDIAPEVPGAKRPTAKTYPHIGVIPFVVLLGLIIAGDQLLWGIVPGIAFPIYILLIAAAAQAFTFQHTKTITALTAWAVLLAALLPAVDVIHPVSLAFAIGGALGFVGIMLGEHGRSAAFAALRFPFYGAISIGVDAVSIAKQPAHPRLGTFADSMRDWIIPAGLGITFGGLLLIANPVLEQWVVELFSFGTFSLPSAARALFWGGLALLIWPFLRLTALRGSLTRPVPDAKAFGQVWYLTPRSVGRALILFNLLFAAQSVTDLAILWGGASLPDGMTYANYAHRGAYPLLVAALLAGGFAMLSQPFLSGRPILRVLLLIWVGQTALLVGSSMLRLDLYIDAYSLTRLRFAAFVWMGVIGGGLVLMIWQLMRGFGPGWLIMRAAELGVITLYACSFINVDGLVARHNLSDNPYEIDAYYMCRLGEGAVVAIAQADARQTWSICGRDFGPKLSTPTDWREWGYRNARLRSKLTQITGAIQ